MRPIFVGMLATESCSREETKCTLKTQPISAIAEELSLPPKVFGEYTILEILGLRAQDILQVGKRLTIMAE